MSIQAKLISVGVDWLTLTTKDSARGVDWHEAFKAVAAIQQQRGHKWTESRRLGYVGEQCGACFWGKGTQGFMVVLSSDVAHDYGALFEPDAVHCTRIDLQVTAELAMQQPELIEKTYNACALWRPVNGRPPKFGLVKDTEGGRTLYVGSRTSMQFGRLYDKGVEQKGAPAGRLLRWELEIKQEYADQAVAMLWGESDQQGVILFLVKNFFNERHVPTVWSASPREDRFIPPHVTPDEAGSLRWLRGPVASVVERILGTVGPQAVLSALFCKSGHLLEEVGLADLLELGQSD